MLYFFLLHFFYFYFFIKMFRVFQQNNFFIYFCFFLKFYFSILLVSLWCFFLIFNLMLFWYLSFCFKLTLRVGSNFIIIILKLHFFEKHHTFLLLLQMQSAAHIVKMLVGTKNKVYPMLLVKFTNRSNQIMTRNSFELKINFCFIIAVRIKGVN